MAKAFRGDAVASLPRSSNNASHGSLRLTRRVKYFQFFHLIMGRDKVFLGYPVHAFDQCTDMVSFWPLGKKIS